MKVSVISLNAKYVHLAPAPYALGAGALAFAKHAHEVVPVPWVVGKDRDAFPLLIPCTEEYKTMVAKEAESLESRFILSEDTALLEHSPIADFPREGGVLR